MDDIVVSDHELVTVKGKEFIVFNIAITIDGATHRIKRRYSDLLLLHKDLKRHFPTLTLPVFPPKQVRNFNARNLESRRKALDQYLYSVFSNYQLHDSLLDYLNIPRIFSNTSDDFSLGSFDQAEACSHAAVIKPKVEEVDFSGFANDIVILGVMEAMYN